MSKTLFILGAGASHDAGAPLMASFLQAAEGVSERHEAQTDREHFDLVFKALRELEFINSKAAIDLQNLEAVFGVFEMAAMCGRLGDLTSDEIERLPRAMRRVILRTLELTVRFPIINNTTYAPPPYGDLLTFASKLGERGFGSVAFVTLNYDIALDFAVHQRGYQIDYCLGAPTGGIEVMKLHGSLNWTRCATCDEIVAWQVRDYLQKHHFGRVVLPMAPGHMMFSIGSHLGELTHSCGHACDAEPVIVPPTWNKAEYGKLAQVWRRTAKHLAEAEHIFVVGYSLPPADEFFRYLYAVGAYAKTRLKHFYVIDPDPKGEVASQYEKMLGPVAGRSPVFQPIRHTLDDAIRMLAGVLLQTNIEREIRPR